MTKANFSLLYQTFCIPLPPQPMIHEQSMYSLLCSARFTLKYFSLAFEPNNYEAAKTMHVSVSLLFVAAYVKIYLPTARQ